MRRPPTGRARPAEQAGRDQTRPRPVEKVWESFIVRAAKAPIRTDADTMLLLAKAKLFCPVWQCPDPRPLTPGEAACAAKVYQRVTAIAHGYQRAACAAGVEIRTAVALLEDSERRGQSGDWHWERKCRKLLLRPAMEPIALSYWPRLRAFELDDEGAVNLASALDGRSIGYRDRPCVGRSERGNIGFEPVDMSRGWLTKLHRVAGDSSLRLALPLFAFAQTLMSHPFRDGNGRMSRLMLHAGLAKILDLSWPALPLAPFFYQRAESIGDQLSHLNFTRKWDGFYIFMLNFIDEICSSVTMPNDHDFKQNWLTSN